MQSTSSFLSLPGQLCPGVVAPDRVLFMGEIRLNYALTLNWIVKHNTVLKLTECKQKIFLYLAELFEIELLMYKNTSGINGQQRLMGHLTKPNQTTHTYMHTMTQSKTNFMAYQISMTNYGKRSIPIKHTEHTLRKGKKKEEKEEKEGTNICRWQYRHYINQKRRLHKSLTHSENSKKLETYQSRVKINNLKKSLWTYSF